MEAGRINPSPETTKVLLSEQTKSVVAQAVKSIRSRITPRTVFTAMLTTGLIATIHEVERQRQALLKVQEDNQRLQETNEAVVQYVAMMIDETECGQEAYLYLQVKAEEEEVADLSALPEDEPIPYIPADPVS